jgi:hypothetical protein
VEGARVVAGGGRPADQDRGFFVEPTIFTDVENGHRIAREEILGPVLSVILYSTDPPEPEPDPIGKMLGRPAAARPRRPASAAP